MDMDERISLHEEIRVIREQEEDINHAKCMLQELEEEEVENLKHSFQLQDDLAERYGNDAGLSSLLDDRRLLLRRKSNQNEDIFLEARTLIKERLKEGEQQKYSNQEKLREADEKTEIEGEGARWD